MLNDEGVQRAVGRQPAPGSRADSAVSAGIVCSASAGSPAQSGAHASASSAAAATLPYPNSASS